MMNIKTAQQEVDNWIKTRGTLLQRIDEYGPAYGGSWRSSSNYRSTIW